MKEYQNLIGKVILAVAIIVGAMIIGNAILEASGNIGRKVALQPESVGTGGCSG